MANLISPMNTATNQSALAPGNASVLALATMGLSGNKYMLGLMILLINLGARYIGNEVGDFMHKVLNHKFARRFLIFLVLWMGTRDLVVAGVITIGFIVLVNTIFNENSSLCILPIQNNSPINKEEYLLAKELVNKYEFANPPIPSSMQQPQQQLSSQQSQQSQQPLHKNNILPINNNMINNQ
jgi:hypothetical protein